MKSLGLLTDCITGIHPSEGNLAVVEIPPYGWRANFTSHVSRDIYVSPIIMIHLWLSPCAFHLKYVKFQLDTLFLQILGLKCLKYVSLSFDSTSRGDVIIFM